MPFIDETATRLARKISSTQDTIRRNTAALIEELELMRDHLNRGYRLDTVGGQRVTDLDRAVIEHQAAWDMVVELGYREDAIAEIVKNS